MEEMVGFGEVRMKVQLMSIHSKATLGREFKLLESILKNQEKVLIF